MIRGWLFIPLMLFAGLCGFLLWGFFLDDPHQLPSTRIGKPFPPFELPSLTEPGQVISQERLKGQVALVNVWATWCPTCRAEHDALLRLGKRYQLPVIGINYKDDVDDARQWLRSLGDPYLFTVVDQDGRLGIDLGVYGAPESFLVDAAGIIRYKRVGDVNERVWEQEIEPLVNALRAQVAGQ